MAYGLKYTSSFYSEAWSGTTSTQYILKIYKEGFSGSSEEVCMGGNPCTEKAINSDDLPYGVKGCRYEFEIVSDALSVDDFYTEDGKDFLFELYEAGTPDVLIRKGYLISEDVSEEYSDGTKTITITGTDGLELLKTINYELVDDKAYQGIASVFSILFNCLDKIGLGIKFNTAFNYYPNGVTAGDGVDSLAFHSLHQELFKGLNCYEVLERLTQTHQCVLEQEDGEWWYIHKINPTGATVTYRKWDSGGTFIDDYVFPEPIDVVFEGEYAPVERPQVLKNRPYKRVISEVDLKGYENKLRNADFQDGFLQWNSAVVDSYNFYPVDSYSFGGQGLRNNPYYIQINGWSNRIDFGLAPKVVYQNVVTLYDSSFPVNDVYKVLERGVRVSGKVIGNGVKSTDFGVRMVLTFDNYDFPVIFELSETGEWESRDAGTPAWTTVPLVYENGLSKEEYTSFSIESKSIGKAAFPKTFYNRIFNNKLIKLDIAEMLSCKIEFVISEGIDQTTIVASPEWVRWAELEMEIIDKTRSVGLKKNRYISKKSGVAPNELKIERYFSDFYEKEQFISILGGDGVTPTSLWTTTNNNNTGDLLTALTRELFSLYYKPVSLYDGNILGRVKKYHTINLVDYTEPLFNVNWGYDFGRNIVDGSRYIMTFPVYIGTDNKKYGVYNDDKEILYDGDYPTGQLDFDEVPILNGDLIAKNLTRIKENVVFDDYMTFSKSSNESGINWYDSITGDKTDYFLTTADGFAFKSETNPYKVTLDFTALTANTRLIIPPLSGDSSLVTTETGWLLNGNALTASKSIGSTTNFDVELIANNTTKISLFASGGVTVHSTTNFDDAVGIDGIVTLNSIANATTDTNKFLVSDNGEVKYRTGTQLLSDIGGFASPSGLTTNYVTKWNGATLTNSQIFDNGNTVSIGSALGISNKFEVGNASYGTIAAFRSVPLDGINPYLAIKTSANGVTIEQNGSQYKNLYFQTSALDRLTILANGNVGIGTTSPANKLHVLSASSTIAMIESSASQAFFGLKAVSGGVVYFGNNNSGDFTIQTAGSGYSDKFYITSSGNVGIGTTSPSAKLHVVGDSYIYAQSTLNNVNLYRTDAVGNFISMSTNFVGGSTVQINPFIYGVNNGGLEIKLNGTQRFVIDTSGNVGIGTTSPSERLQVDVANIAGLKWLKFSTSNGANNYGDFSVQSAELRLNSPFNIGIAPNNTVSAFFATSGNVGIGTTNPSGKLDVNGTSRTTNLKITNGATVGYVWQCNNADGSGVWTSPLASERYIGEWAANSGSAPSGSPTTGDYWVVNTAGTYSGTAYVLGDEIYWNGTTWLKRSNYLTLPTASAGTLGGIRIGSGLSIDGSGIVSVATLNQNTTGSAATLTTARNIAMTGDVAWNVDFNGSGNVTAVGTLATVNSNVGTFAGITVNGKGLVTGATALTTLAGYGITDAWTKTESDGRYVDLFTDDQEVNGRKYFFDGIRFRDTLGSLATISRSGYSKDGGATQAIILDAHNVGIDYTDFFAVSKGGNIKFLYSDSGLLIGDSLDFETFSTEKLHINGNIRYSGTLKPNNVQGTAGQFLKNNGSGNVDTWATIGHADITNLSSFTGFDGRYSLLAHNHSLDSLSNVAISSNTSGEILKWSGSAWINNTPDEANLVDKSNVQTINGTKTFGNTITVGLSGSTVTLGGLGFFAGIANVGGTGAIVRGTTYTKLQVGTNDRLVVYDGGVRISAFSTNYLTAPTERLQVDGNIRYNTLLKPNNIAGTNKQVLSTNGTQDIWVSLGFSYLSDVDISPLTGGDILMYDNTSSRWRNQNPSIALLLQIDNISGLQTALYNKQPLDADLTAIAELSGTSGFLKKTAANTWSLDTSTYLTTSTASSTYQPLLPSGTAGQFLIRNASNALEFSKLELEPVRLTSNKIAVGDSVNYLSSYDNFEFNDSRFINILKTGDSSRSLAMGMYGLSNNSFVTASGGSLTVRGDNGLIFSNFTGGGTQLLTIDNFGKVGVTPLGSSGGGSTSLTNTYIGYGSGGNVVTGTSTFTFLDGRYIHFSSSVSDFNVGTLGTVGFVESVNGNLNLQARGAYGVVVDDGFFKVNELSGSGTRMVTVDSTGKFETQAIPSGGTPSLTAMNIGYGSGSNLLTSSGNFQYDAAKTAMYFNDGGNFLYVGKSTALSDMYEITAVGTRGIQLNTDMDIVIKNNNHLYLGAGADNKRVHIGRGASYNSATHYLVINGERFSFSMDNIPGWGDSNSDSTPQVGDKVLFNVVSVGGETRFVPQKINKKSFSSLTSGDTVLIL